jgi:hypothetical protein
MNNVRKLLLILMGALAMQTAFAQSLHIRSDIGGFTTVMDTTFMFDVEVRNDSTISVSGPLTFGYSIDDFNTAITYFGSDTSSGISYTPTSITLNQGNKDTITLTTTVKLPKFKAGPSVVVIWPIVPGASAVDSVKFTFTALAPSGFNYITGNQLKAFILNNQLQIQANGDVALKQLRIYNVAGQQILNEISPANTTQLPAMPKGIYLAEISYGDNQRSIFRFYY